MIEEFHKQLKENQDLSQLLHAIDQIPELPHVEYQPTLSQLEINQIASILNQLAKIRQDKLNKDLILEFHDLLQTIPKKETTFYQSCLKQHNRHLKSLDYHSQHELSNLSLNAINIETITWLKQNSSLLNDLNDSILKKFQELVLYQLEQISIDFDQQKSFEILFESKNLLVQKLESDKISLQLNSLISKQSEMVEILVGFLIFFDNLKMDLTDFLINTISSKYRQYFIAKGNVIFDEIGKFDPYEKQIKLCLEKANLQEILEKQSHYNQIDQLKQNLIRFKDTYINLLEQLQFKQQKQQNWKLGFFKTKTDDTSKLPNQFIEHLLNDWKTLDKFILNNSEKNEKQFQLIFDHLRLLDVCLDHKEITHSFQSLNFYVTIYSQIDEKLIKLLKYWTSNNDQLINFICNIKIKLRQYQLKSNEFIDL